MRWPAAAALLTLAVPSAARAQVTWTRDAGSAYANLKLSLQSGDTFYGADFERRPINDYRQTSLSLYSELGLIDRYLTLSLEGELFRRNELVSQGATEGLGDLRVGLWTGLVVAPFRLSVGARVGLPTGDADPSAGADAEATAIARTLPTGDGEFDVEPAVSIGTSFGGGADWPVQHYATAGVGYWLRTRGIADALTYKLELGTKVPVVVLDRVWWIVRATGIESFASAADVASSQGNFGGLGNGVTFVSLGLEAAVQVWGGLGVSLAWDTAFRARRVIGAAPLRIAVSYEF